MPVDAPSPGASGNEDATTSEVPNETDILSGSFGPTEWAPLEQRCP